MVAGRFLSKTTLGCFFQSKYKRTAISDSVFAMSWRSAWYVAFAFLSSRRHSKAVQAALLPGKTKIQKKSFFFFAKSQGSTNSPSSQKHMQGQALHNVFEYFGYFFLHQIKKKRAARRFCLFWLSRLKSLSFNARAYVRGSREVHRFFVAQLGWNLNKVRQQWTKKGGEDNILMKDSKKREFRRRKAKWVKTSKSSWSD